MAKKIYVSPSSQTANIYAVGNTNEAVECRKIALATVAALKRCGFDAITNIEDGPRALYNRVAESNRWGADAHIAIHTNAYNGKVSGFRGFYYDEESEGKELCEDIMDEVAPLTPGQSDSIRARPGFYEISATAAPCAYLELGFHDNPEEAQYIIDHTDELAEAICKGVCDFYDVKYVPPANPK